MRECSSRITVQFLNQIDHNHESQLRKFLKSLRDILLMDIWHILIVKKNAYTTIYMLYLS